MTLCCLWWPYIDQRIFNSIDCWEWPYYTFALQKNLQSASILSIWKVVFKCLLVFLHTSTIVLFLYSIVVKEKLQEYCAIQFSRSGLNQMWILQNLESISFTKFNSIYMLNIHSSIKSTFVDIIDNCFSNKTWSRKFTYPVID